MPPPQQRGALGGNLVLASLLALLSYVPFEWVAKGTLILSGILFVLDPIPPTSRLLSVLSLLVVFGVTKIYNQHKHELEVVGEVTLEQEERPSTAHQINTTTDPKSTSKDKAA